MRKIIIAIVILCFIVALGCKKNENSNYTKVKCLGEDMRMCACCGGYFMAINNDSTYRAVSLDGKYKDSILVFGTEYLIQYKNADMKCGAGEKLIDITDLKPL